MTLRRARLLVAMLCWLAITPRVAAQVAKGSITIERVAAIKRPTDPAWSPDGKKVAFLWDSAGKQDLFVATPGQAPLRLTDLPLNPDMLLSDIQQFAWLSDEVIWFGKDGRLWTVALAAPAPTPTLVPDLEDAGAFALSKDRQQIAFIRRGQIWLAATTAARKAPRPLTFLEESFAASAPIFAPDAKHVVFQATRSSVEQLPMPFNGNWVREFRALTSERRLGIASVYGGDPVWIQASGEVGFLQWTADGLLVFEEISPDRTDRFIKVVSVDGTTRVLWQDHDPKTWTPTAKDSKVVVSPDGKSVAFVSDRTGWMRLYVVPVSATSPSQARQLTSGNFLAGIAFGAWSADSKRIAYHHSVDGNEERLIDIVDVATGKSEPVVAARGVSYDPMYSPDGTNLLFLRSSAEHAQEVFTVPARAGAQMVRLTNSMPAGLQVADLSPPVSVRFPSRVDGKPVPGTLMVSKRLDRTRKHPAIVWLHGSGPAQNYLGWDINPTYWMYYGVHQYLAQQGYVILTVDYRRSSGYSREWATGSYMDMGGAETLDVASGADYLKTLNFVDPDRIGVWGLSYGGFMTLQSVTVTPTVFRAAIDVAGVTDWETWNRERPSNHKGLMGMPSDNPDGYDQMAPYRHMDKLVRPLMIMHGTNDTSVNFRETLQLIDAMVKLGKHFELVVYPGEVHSFRRAHVLRDAWWRAEQFFDRELKNGEHIVTTEASRF